MALEAAMLGLSAFEGYQQYKAGKEANKAYQAQAAEVETQTAYAQRAALEEVKDITREGRSAESKAIATAGGSGLRVGGSTGTVVDRIRADVARQRTMTAFQFSETARRNQFVADQYRYAGKRARRAGRIGMFGSLLTGGLKFGKQMYKHHGWFGGSK